MIEPNLEKCRQEVEELRTLPPVTIEIPLLAAMEIVGYIQLATKNPAVGEGEFGKMAIDIARKLQNFLDPSSECFKLLEFGWELQSDLRKVEFGCDHQADQREAQELLQRVLNIFGGENIDTDQEEFCEEPCANFLQNLGCRCTGYHVAEVVAGDEDIAPKTLAAGAAMMHQIKQNLRSEGFKLDM